MSDRPIRAIIVDDEELARRGIEIRLAAHPDVQIVGHCENGREALEAVAREKPDLVVGDFNAPRRSWRLSRLPDGYRDAYDVAGAGWAGTWPSPLPIWSLDHVLAGPGVRVRSYRLPLSWRSDHRPQLVEVEVPRRPEQ